MIEFLLLLLFCTLLILHHFIPSAIPSFTRPRFNCAAPVSGPWTRFRGSTIVLFFTHCSLTFQPFPDTVSHWPPDRYTRDRPPRDTLPTLFTFNSLLADVYQFRPVNEINLRFHSLFRFCHPYRIIIIIKGYPLSEEGYCHVFFFFLWLSFLLHFNRFLFILKLFGNFYLIFSA